MNITDWDNNEVMRLVMAKGHMTQKLLLQTLEENSGEKLLQSTFSAKIKRNGLKLAELQQICKVLGYKLILERIED